jgi:predicted Zn-dependent peptidase
LLLERHDTPVVRANLIVTRGASDGSPAVVQLAAAALRWGSQSALREDIDKRLGESSTGTWFSADGFGLTLEALAPDFGEPLKAACELIANPGLRPADFERERQYLVRWAPATDVNSEVSRAVDDALYLGTSPRARADQEELLHVTRDDLVKFFNTEVVPDQVVAVVAGDITVPALRDLLAAGFAQFRGFAVPRREISQERPAPSGDRMLLIDQPGRTQSTIRIAAPGAGRTHPDYEPLAIVSEVLGGGSGWTGRLNQKLRTEHAYTYDASSWLSSWRGGGPFVIASKVDREDTAEAIRQVLSELERLRSDRVSDQELARAKVSYVNGIARELSTLYGAISALSALALYELPADHYATLEQRLARVTPSDLQRVARAYLDSDQLREVILGDAHVVRGPIEALHVGPLRVVPSRLASRAERR